MQTVMPGFYDDPKNYQLRERVNKLLDQCSIDFTAIFNEAQQLTHTDANRKQSHYKGRNFMSENMYGNIMGLMTDNYPTYVHYDSYKRPFLKLDKDVYVYIKKLTPKTYVPSNVITNHVKALRYQQLFDSYDKVVNVLFGGYVLKDEDWFLPLEETCISYLNKFYYDQAAWTIDVKAYPKYQTIITPLTKEETELPLVTVPETITKTQNK